MLAENRFPEKMNFFYKFLTYNAQKCYKMEIHSSRTSTLVENLELKLLILIHDNAGQPTTGMPVRLRLRLSWWD